MTRRRALNQLHQTRTTLEHAVAEFETWHRWISGLIPDGYPAGSDPTAVGGGNISDPTGTTAIHRQKYQRLVTEAERTIDRLYRDVLHLDDLLASGPKRQNITELKRAARCSGAVDPTCTNIADGRRHKTGLCDRCWMVRYRTDRDTPRSA
jgi:hypothetical protein